MTELCFFCFLVKSRYYDDKQSRNINLTENNDWEITVLKNNDLETFINGQPLFIWRNNGPDNNGR